MRQWVETLQSLFRNYLKNIDKKIAIGAIGIIFLIILSVPTYYLLFNKKNGNVVNNIIPTQSADVVPITTEKEPPAPEQQQASEKITEAPPKYAAPKKKTATNIITHTDGTKTATVTDGDISSTELTQIASLGPSGSLPSSIRFTDETGQFGSLETVIKNFLNEKLKWGNEISYLYNITVRDAGETGWEGQYAGSYQMDSTGKIVSAYGYIILNVSYHKTDPHFEDYMKLVFSHEYGHHYTLYHKWVGLNLPTGVRFPDTYYSIRPLSKEATAVDYSKGWANCESEIIAEDYSYLYSGYGFHAMSSTFGYPAPAVKTWLENLAQASQSTTTIPATPTTVIDNPPFVSIISPASDSTVSGTVLIQTNASDDIGILKVEFYIDSTRLGEVASSPYQFSFSSAAYSNSEHIIKAVAYDTKLQTGEKSINLIFSNTISDTEKPVITLEKPVGNPYDWTAAESVLPINIRTSDNIGVVRIKVYINNHLQINQASSALNLTWAYDSAPAGEYTIKIQAYDGVGNMGETVIVINKV